jgi:outer membrane protein assembly factor BamB
MDPGLSGKLPRIEDPQPFHDSSSGLSGWKLRLPGGLPLATPAVVNGRVFVGGGFGSYEFYGLDADSGRVVWQYRTDVFGVWAYQGSKPFVSGGRLFSGLGDTVHCADPDSKEVFWKKKLRDGDGEAELLDSLLTPPALANGKLFLGTLDGRAVCLVAGSGETLWSVQLGEQVLLQPAVARGRAYFPTATGSLYCLETGDVADDGWLMWGATPAHNGLPGNAA